RQDAFEAEQVGLPVVHQQDVCPTCGLAFVSNSHGPFLRLGGKSSLVLTPLAACARLGCYPDSIQVHQRLPCPLSGRNKMGQDPWQARFLPSLEGGHCVEGKRVPNTS